MKQVRRLLPASNCVHPSAGATNAAGLQSAPYGSDRRWRLGQGDARHLAAHCKRQDALDDSADSILLRLLAG